MLKRNTVICMCAMLCALALLPGIGRGEDAATSKPQEDSAAKSEASPAMRDVQTLKEQIARQQQQIEQLQKSLIGQKQLLERMLRSSNPVAAPPPASSPAPAARPADLPQVASTTPLVPRSLTEPENASATVAGVSSAAAAANPDPAAPVQFHVGSAYITPVGFMDFTSVWRNHAAGTSIGTNFAGIPYGTTAFQNNLSEFRMSMQNSRIGFRVDALVGGAKVLGYMEADFLGNNPGNVAVSSNSNTLRSRLYWVDLRKGSWEVLGGQTWSLLTPGRNGISPLPADIFYSQDMDVNYQLGLFWARNPELRVVYHHPSNKAAFAIAIDSPEQYVGGSAGGSLIALPSNNTLNKNYSSELNTGGNGTSVPNVAPDVIAKFLLEPSKKFHLEVGGIERNFKLWDPNTGYARSTAGGGGFLNLNFELFKGMRILTNNFLSDGGGRYIFGQAPDLIVKADGNLSLVHAGSTVTGFEYTYKDSLLYAYYGGLYVGRNTALDADGKTLIGYGYNNTYKATSSTTLAPPSTSAQNRAIQEPTFGLVQTFWKNAKYGALSLITQYSYLTRNPWYVAAGNPRNADLHMVFVDLRYTLPGSAPTLGPPGR